MTDYILLENTKRALSKCKTKTFISNNIKWFLLNALKNPARGDAKSCLINLLKKVDEELFKNWEKTRTLEDKIKMLEELKTRMHFEKNNLQENLPFDL